MAFLLRSPPTKTLSKRLFNSSKHITTRSIWTSLTSTGSSIEECVQVSVESLKNKEQIPDICVVLVSKSFTLNHYRSLTQELYKTLKPTVFLGGVIDRVPQVDHGISLLLGYDEKIVPFTIQDSQDRLKIRSTSVGRWGRVDDLERLKFQSDHIDKAGGWKGISVSTPAQPFQLPPGLAKEVVPSFVFTISDNEPDQLLQTLDHHYPAVPKVGIIGASTPFVTGTPYTLFEGEQIMGSGIVGFASYSTREKKKLSVHHAAMQKLGEPVKITRCRGNIILDLDEAGATGLLLKLIQEGRNRISKDEEFYLAVYPPDAQGGDENVTVSRITSGDPGRGNMSVDTTADLQVGQTVQFLRKKDLQFENVSSDRTIQKNEIVFGVSGKDYTIDAAPVQIPEEAAVIPDIFGSVSENGVVVGRGSASSPSEVLDVPYSKVTFKL